MENNESENNNQSQVQNKRPSQNRNQNQNKNRNQNRNKNGDNNGKNQNQNNRKRDQDNNGKEENDKEMMEKEQKEKERRQKEKEKKESRKDRERQICLLTNKLSRDKKDYMLCSTRQYNLDKDRYSKKDTDVCCSSCPPRDASLDEARCPGSGKKIKPNKDKMRCFTANMICQKLYMPGRDFECQDKLKIMVDICQGCKPCLKADRINVNCLPEEPCKCFAMEAECLERRLEEGILLTIIYQNREIGHGCYVLPESCILRLVNMFDVVTHTANVELTCHGCTVGMCTVHLAMQMRCQDLKLVMESTENRSEMEHLKGGMDICIDSMSFPSSSTDSCVGYMTNEADFETESGSGCHGLFGDIGTEDSPPEENVLQPEKLVDMAGPYCFYGQENEDDDDGCLPIEASPQFSPNRNSVYGEGVTNRMFQTISVPQLKQTCVSASRFCSVCKEDVSWLPKIAACPHCGYKPVPVFNEKPYDENATADDLLHSCLEQPDELQPCSSDSAELHGDYMPGRAHSSEAFETLLRNYEHLKQSIKRAESPKDSFARQSSEGEKRRQRSKEPAAPPSQQNMAAVFGELKELFKLKDCDTNAKIQKICDEAHRMSKSSKLHQKRGSKSNDKCEAPVQKKKQRRPRKKINFKSRVYSMPSRLKFSKTEHDHGFDGPTVPPHMGWLWTSHPLAKKAGWRPGSIRRSTRQLMRYFLRDFPLDTIPVSKYMSFYRQKQPPPPSGVKERPEELVQHPTLYIEKKNDEYIITLRPLKAAGTLERSANPYVNMKPVQFRIVKNPLLKEIRDLKRCLKCMGFRKCTCHRPVIACFCRSFIEKKQLIDELQKECERRDMDSCENALVLSDTSDSEAEFEFGVTPPAGLIHPERLKTPTHVINAATQYDENDWVTPSAFPHAPNRFVQYGACVVGERKKEFNWIYGKGKVHEEPKAPVMRNKPKKKERKPKFGARQAGGFARENAISGLRQSHVAMGYDTDSEYPLTEERMKRLNQAAYAPNDPQRHQKPRHVRFAAAKSVNSNLLP